VSARRAFMRRGAGLALGGGMGMLLSATARAGVADAPVDSQASRLLALAHTHTRERIELVFAIGARYSEEALTRLNRFLRDHYSGEVGQMDPQLFDQLHRLRAQFGDGAGAYEVISGYRCEATNRHLRQTRAGGVAKRSLHMLGRAIDVRLPGVPLAELRAAALALRAGGVGYYPREQFVHLDTGPLRSW
jgi:uncharacterized protein YcbK (DUF882 family)